MINGGVRARARAHTGATDRAERAKSERAKVSGRLSEGKKPNRRLIAGKWMEYVIYLKGLDMTDDNQTCGNDLIFRTYTQKASVFGANKHFVSFKWDLVRRAVNEFSR